MNYRWASQQSSSLMRVHCGRYDRSCPCDTAETVDQLDPVPHHDLMITQPPDLNSPTQAPRTRFAARRPRLTTRRSRGLLALPAPGLLREDAFDFRLRRDGFVWCGQHFTPGATGLANASARLLADDADRRPLALRPYDDPAQIEIDELVGHWLDEAAQSLTAQRIIRRGIVQGPSAAPGNRLDRGWAHIDEFAGGRSISVLVGLGPAAARLGVVRHSHRMDNSARGTHLRAGWLQHTDILRHRILHIAVAAGDVVVLDDATVHAWYAVDPAVGAAGDGERIPAVAVLGTAPLDTPLIHLRRVNVDSAGCADVSESFFLQTTPASLRTDPPAAASLIPIDDPVIWPEDLRQALRTPLSLVDDAASVLDRLRRRI